MRNVALLIFTIFLMFGCVVDQGKVAVDIKRKTPTTNASTLNASVSNVQIINNQLVITGIGFANVSNVVVNGNSLNQNFTIESKSATQIIANAVNAFSFDVSKVFNLILSDANAAASFPIDFSICNATLNGHGFNCALSATDKDVLSFDAVSGKWKPRSINGLNYQGTWDATTTEPSGASSGDYYIVSIANAPTYAVGDWIVWNGTAYDKISNSTTITSVFGRSGAIVATKGDYDLNKLFDVDLTVPPTIGQVLKYDGSKWVAGSDLSGGGAGSVTTAELANGSVTDAKIDTVSATKITGTITSAQVADGTIVNADISASAAIDYSKLNIPNGTIPYAKLNIANGDIPAAKISGLPSATSVLATSITDNDTTHAPDGNAVHDALAAKLNTTGGTLTVGTISGVPNPTNNDDVANKAYVDSAISGYTSFTEAQVLGTDLLGLNTGVNGPIVAADTVLGAMGKLQYQVTDLKGNGQWIKTGNDIAYSAGNVTVDKSFMLKDSGSNHVEIKAPATVTTNYVLTLPPNDGNADQVLRTDGNGVLTWVDVSDSNVQTFAKTTLPTCAAGEVLKSNGTAFSCVTDVSGGGAFTGTNSRAVATDGSGALTSSATTATELGYVSGVTSSIQTQIDAKQATITAGTTAQYYRGDKTFVTLDTSVVPENTNLYFTTARAKSATVADAIADAVLDVAPSQNAVHDALALKLNLTGGTLSVGTINGVPNPTNSDDVANKAYVDTKIAKSALPTCGAGEVLKSDGTNITCVTDASGAGAFTGSNNRAVATDGSGALTSSATTSTELGYVSGVTSSIQTQLNAKQATITATTSADYYRGDKTFATLNTTAVPEGTALYFTEPRVLAAALTSLNTGVNGPITAADSILGAFGKLQYQITDLKTFDTGVQAFAKTTLPTCAVGEVLKSNGTAFSCVTDASGAGAFAGTAGRAVATDGSGALTSSATTSTELGYVSGVTSAIQTQLNAKQATITATTSADYYRGDKTFATLNTTAVPEGTSLYFTDARVRASALTGLSLATNGPITDTDTTLGAFGKLQYQVTALKTFETSVQTFAKTTLPTCATGEVLKSNGTSLSCVTDASGAGAFSGTANRAIASDGSGALAASATTATELGYVSGVTSAIQTQIDSKINKTGGTLSVGTINGVPTPTNNDDIVNKAYVDSFKSKMLYFGAFDGFSFNIYAGSQVGNVATATGTSNTAFGDRPLQSLTSGYRNVAFGIAALGGVTSGSSNIGIGQEAGNNITTGSNNIVIGNNASVASATGSNQLSIANLIYSDGTNVGIGTSAPGAKLEVSGNLNVTGKARLKSDNANYVELLAPASLAATYAITFPPTAGSNNQVLTTNGSGVLSWSTPATGGAPTGSAGGDLGGSYPNPTISGLAATKIGGGAVDNTEFSYLDGVTSSIQTQLTGKQASDATLTSLAAYNTNGILVQTAADTFAGRSIAGTANRVTVTNGDGVAANPTINLDTTLFPSPVAGDTGKFLKTTAANTSVWSSMASGDITTALGFTPLNKAGDTMATGTWALSGTAAITVPNPVNLLDVANKQYVDGFGQWTKGTGGNSGDLYRSSGKIGIGTSTPSDMLMLSQSDSDLGITIENTTSSTAKYPGIIIDNYSGSASGGSTILLRANRGTKAASTPVGAYDTLGQITFQGRRQNAGNISTGASIIAQSREAWTNTTAGSALIFNTTAIGATDVAERMRINGYGDLGVGTDSPAAKFHAHKDFGGVSNVSAGFIGGTDGAVGNSGMYFMTKDATALSSNTSYLFNAVQNATSKMVLTGAGNVGLGTASPAANTILDIASTTKAFAPPRMTKTQRDAIATPTAGLMVFNTTDNTVDYYNGSNWLGLNGAPKFIKLGMSAYQTVNNNDIVAFDTVRASSGLTRSGNGVALKAGVTYRLEAGISTVFSTDTHYVGYQFYNGTSTFGSTAYTFDGDEQTWGFKAPLLEIYKPTVDEVVSIRIIDDRIGTGSLSNDYNTHLLVTEMSGSSPVPGADNLGNHVATQNINLGTNFLSYDGNNRGIRLSSGGGSLQGTSGQSTLWFVQNSDIATGVGSGSYLGTTAASGNVASQLQAFGSGNSTAMPLRIQPFGGKVSINTSSNPSYELDVYGDARINALIGGQLNGSGNFHLDARATGGTYLNWITGTGGAYIGNGGAGFGVINAAVFAVNSDRTLKKNIVPIENALDIILNINGVKFDWISRNETPGRQVGVIAQDVKKVLPELVSVSGQTKKLTVNYPALVAPLIEAVKELYHKWFDDSAAIHREIATVKAESKKEIEALKAENEALKAYMCSKDAQAPFCKTQPKKSTTK